MNSCQRTATLLTMTRTPLTAKTTIKTYNINILTTTVFYNLQMSKADNQKPGGSGENEKLLKRKIQLLEEKNAQLELLANEQEPEQKKTKTFVDYRLENESLLKSAKRRLKFQHNKNPKKVLETIQKIVEEAENDLSPEIKEVMIEMSGNAWPMQVTSCLDFNTGGCIKTFCHAERSRNRQNEEFFRLHICCICLELFKVAIFHQGSDCQTLRLIDEKAEMDKHRALINCLNQNVQISSKK